MTKLINDIYKFADSLNKSQPVYLNIHGSWRVESRLKCWLRKTLGLEIWAKIEFARHFNLLFEQLEQICVRFPANPSGNVKQLVDFDAYLTAAQAVKNTLARYGHPDIVREAQRLNRHIIALLYRLEEENGGLSKGGYDFDLFNSLCDRAAKWKEQQRIFWYRDLSVADIKQLEHACRYPDFIQLLLEDDQLLHDFLIWTLRDGMDVDPYVEFPGHQKLISACNLRGRIGRLGGDLLKVQKMELPGGINLEKVLTLPFEGKEISILDKTLQVVFRGNYSISIKKVFQIFRDKPIRVGDLELFGQGITNWNAIYLGWWNADKRAYEVIDMEEAVWWRALPTLEVLTTDEARRRYGTHLDGRNWNLAAKASREYLSLHFEKTHAYLEIAIPAPDGRHYTIYDFGKFAVHLPATLWETLRMFCVTVPAAIAYPDENIFMSNRQHVGYSFELTPEEGYRYMSSIKEDILKARGGNSVFQIETENCGKWIQVRLEEQLGKERVPNLYRVSLLQAQPVGWWKQFFQFIRSLPKYWQAKVLAWAHLPLAPWKGRWIVDKDGQKIWKSVVSSSFWQDTVVYLPAYLHDQHEQGVFAEDPQRHKVTLRGYFDMRTKGVRKVDPFYTLDLFNDQN